MKIDYSQYGQALLLAQLIVEETPRVVVDIGANDGICGSNSRALLESGWQGLLVEPLPRIFEQLRRNSAAFPKVSVIQAACSDHIGSAEISIGRDGELGQMSSLSRDPDLLANLSNTVVEVETVTLPDLIATHHLPDEFGILLVDTEGWDLTIIRTLINTSIRPRIIVTEDFVNTNEAKYALLESLGYQNVGIWASDSFWVHGRASVSIPLQPPVCRFPPQWKPYGALAGTGNCMHDQAASYRNSIAGWAWSEKSGCPEKLEVIIRLGCPQSGEEVHFESWHTPRPDVSEVFQSPNLLFSGFRSYVDLLPGTYEMTVIQQDVDFYLENRVGPVALPF